MKVYVLFEQFFEDRLVGVFASSKSAWDSVQEKYGDIDGFRVKEYEVRE